MAVQGISPDGKVLLGWSSVPLPFVTVAVILRFVCRRTTAGVKSDDWAMLGATVLFYGLYAAIVTWAVLGKAGWSQPALSPQQLDMFLKMYYIIHFIYGGTATSARVSILLLYRRLFSVIPYIPWTTFIFGTFIVAWTITASIAEIFSCMPLGSFWQWTQHRQCVNTKDLFVVLSVINMTVDLVLLCLPVPTIWKLRISVRNKIHLSVVFTLGILACVAGALRIRYEHVVNTHDVTDTVAAAIICSSFEAAITIVTGCLPTLGPLLVKWRTHKYNEDRPAWKRVSMVQNCGRKDVESLPSPTPASLSDIRSTMTASEFGNPK